MYLMRPHSLLSASADPDVLAVLAHAGSPLTGREVARRAGRSQDRIRQILERLVDHGIAIRADAGSAHLYSLNREHLAAGAITELTELRVVLVNRLRAEFAGWEIEPLGAALFGSAARGDGDLDSDIDLLIVRPGGVDEEDSAWREQIDLLYDRVRAWTGNPAGIVEVSADDLPHLIKRNPPVLDSIRSDAIDLAGRPIRTLLRNLG